MNDLFKAARRLDARPDVLDLRDRWYAVAESYRPSRSSLSDYRKLSVPVLDQGFDGACAGFALATVANRLTGSHGRTDAELVSPWMLHEIGRRYADEDATTISLRSGLKGWHRHGVCASSLWPDPTLDAEPALTAQRSADATARRLAGYFRIDHRDLASLHGALAETGALAASAWIHRGWFHADASGRIDAIGERIGCHAFAIVAYDDDGLWIQNAWGRGWGRHGLGHLDYEQWLRTGMDVWAVRMQATAAAPVHAVREPDPAGVEAATDLRPHLISLTRDGRLRESGCFGNKRADVQAIFRNDVPRVTSDWSKRRILLHAGSGLDAEQSAIRLASRRAPRFLAREIFPITLLWRSDLRAALDVLLRDALDEPELAQKPPRQWAAAPPREEALERLVRRSLGKTLWDELRSGALQATVRPAGGARLIAGHLAHLLAQSDLELHVWGHGIGAILLAPLVCLLATKGAIRVGGFSGAAGLGVRLATCTLSAPACTPEFFHATYGAAISTGAITQATLLLLDEQAEQQDLWGPLYRRSFLTLVANALEERTPARLIGLAADARADRALRSLIRSGRLDLIDSPEPRTHEDLEVDDALLDALIDRVSSAASPAPASAARSRAGSRAR